MIIQNLTNERITLKMEEIVGEHTKYDIYVEPKAQVEIDKCFRVLGIQNLVSEGTIMADVIALAESVLNIDPAIIDELPDSTREEVAESTEETPVEEVEEKVSPSHVCDICGEEFGSARGLSSHKTRAHAE